MSKTPFRFVNHFKLSVTQHERMILFNRLG